MTTAVVVIVGAAIALLSVLVYGLYGRNVRDRFDEELADDARRLAFAVEAHLDRPWELDLGRQATLDPSRGATWYQVWRDDGSVLARAPSVPSALTPPPRGAPPSFTNLRLTRGRSARLHTVWLSPGHGNAWETRPDRVAVAIARDTGSIDARLSSLRNILWASAVGTLLLASLVTWILVEQSLRAMTRISTTIASLDPSSVHDRVDLRGIPEELAPPFEKLNEVLARIEQTLARERQFSADVSHELRTPLAGLRAILEVSSSRERAAADHRISMREALEIVGQLEAIVQNLLALARLGSGQVAPVHREDVPLRELVDSCFTPDREAAARRGLTFENRVAPECTVSSDLLQLRLIAGNLLANATQYTADGGWIAAESDPAAGIVLRVRDSGPPIPAETLEKVFHPFFRGDPSRTPGEHHGIGLALVRGLCETLGYRIWAENEPGGAVAFTVSAPPLPAGVATPREE